MLRIGHAYGALLTLLVGFSGSAAGQEIRIRQISLREFPVVSFIVSFETGLGVPVPLEPKNFWLYEDGRPVAAAKFEPLDSGGYPLYTALVIDKSGSMKGDAIEQARQGALAFAAGMKDQDRAALVVFDTQVTVASGFSPDRAVLAAKIRGIRTGTDTALIDAVWEAAELMRNVPPEAARIALVLTDGKENRSKQALGKAIENARGLGVSVYTIGLGSDIDPRMLRDIAGQTEANYYHAPAPGNLVEIYRRISKLLHSQLRATYRTEFPMDDKWRVVTIVASHMGKEIQGERSYLSALESRLPTDALLKMRADAVKAQERAAIDKLVGESRARHERRERELTLILGCGAFILLMLLAAVIIRRRSR